MGGLCATVKTLQVRTMYQPFAMAWVMNCSAVWVGRIRVKCPCGSNNRPTLSNRLSKLRYAVCRARIRASSGGKVCSV